MDEKAERRMLEEVALRNAVAMFRRVNAASKRRASIPEVGIFWIDDAGEMFTQSVSLRDAEDYGDFKIFGGTHYDLWSRAVRANPQWKDMEYEDVPRGRVVYRKDPKKPEFVIYMPKQIAKHKNKVMYEFNLPTGYVRFDFTDEHYRMGRHED